MADETKKLTAKEQRFVEEYCKDCNATQAAIRAKYSKRSAAEIGYENLRKPHIKIAIEERLKALSLEAEEVTKLFTDIAKGDIKKYYTVTEVEEPTTIERPLVEAIAKLREEIAFEDEFAERAEYNEEEMGKHKAEQHRRRRKIIRMEMELERNPFATYKVAGPARLVKRTELDMVKLVEDKEAGRIKAVVPGEFGLKVELYPADAALDKLAKMHGLYEKDNAQSKPELVLPEIKVYTGAPPLANSEREVDL